MPFRESIEPLKYDKFHFMPYDEWLKEEWNNRIASCGRVDLPFCQKVALTDPLDRIQFKANFTGSNLMPTAATFTGTVSSVSTDQAVSAGIGTAAMAGYLISNTTTGAYATVLSIADADRVDLSADIFTSVGQGVAMYPYFTSPADIFHVTQSAGGTYITKESYAGTATLTVDAGLSSEWYYIRLEVRDYVSGSLTVKLGTAESAPVDTNGYHEFYLLATGSNVVIESTAAQDFVGSLRLESFELYRMNTDDLTVVFAQNQTDVVAYGPPTPVADALSAGVVMDDANATWADITGGECACFYLTLFSDPCYTSNYLEGVKNECWELDANVQIVGQSIVFGNAGDGERARYVCEMVCPIQCGEAYILAFTVEDYVEGSVEIRFANGNYPVGAAGEYQFERTPSGICTGLDIFEITATGPGITSLSITNIQIRKVPVFEDAALVSECISACDADDCDTVLEYRNDVNVYGFPYEGESLEGYRNRIRFCGSLEKRKAQFNEYRAFKSSPGIYSTVYSDLDDTHVLETGLMPPYLAVALSAALARGDVLLDGTPFVMKEQPTVREQDDTALVMLDATVTKTDQTETFTYRA